MNLPKSEHVKLTDLPAEVTRIQVTFMLGTTPLGTASLPVDLSSGDTTVDFSDVPAAPVEELVSLTIEPESAEISVDGVQTFVVNARFSDDAVYDLSAIASWTSSDLTVAAIEEGGRATGLAEGTTSITATVAEITSEAATLTVTPAAPVDHVPTVGALNPNSGPSSGNW